MNRPPNQGLKLSQTLKLSQSMQMTPQLQLAIKLLQMNNLELSELLNQEISENPFLDVEVPEDKINSEFEDPNDKLDQPYVDLYNYNGYEQVEKESDKESSSFDIENTIAGKYSQNLTPETLSEFLTEQVKSLTETDERQKSVLLILIGNLDENGFLIHDLNELSKELNLTLVELEASLETLKLLDPPGIGAKNSIDSLLVQLSRIGKHNSLEQKLLTIYCDNLEKHKFDQILKAEKITSSELQSALNSLKKLNPYPGRAFLQDQNIPIRPELVVNKIDDEYVTIFIDDELPDLHLSPFYLTMKKDTENKKIKFLKDKYRSAEWLLRCIEQRKRTIHKVADFVVKHQKDFLNNGPQYLKPLTLKDVSSAVDLHESTISRAVNGKYIVTPRGTFELKDFFSNAISKTVPSYGKYQDPTITTSSQSVLEQIKLIIDSETIGTPYSDEDIKQKLSVLGIAMARRTVAKYREDLGIPSSAHRKRQQNFSQITGS